MSIPTLNARIALLTNYLYGSYQSRFRDAFERAASAHGVDLLVAVGRELEHGLEYERVLNQMYEWVGSNSVQGVAVLSAAISNFTGKTGVERLCESLAPLPCYSIGLQLAQIPSVVIDNQAAMKMAALHLIDVHSCRHVAYIGGPESNEEARARRDGYRAALDEARLGFDERRVAFGHFTRDSGAAAVGQLFARNVPIDALVVANDDMALGAVDALYARALRVPDDVKVIGFDDAPMARFARRPLTTVAQSLEDMASAAVEGLLETLRGGRAPSLTISPVSLIARESCGCGHLHSSGRDQARRPEAPAADYLRAIAADGRGHLGAKPANGEHALLLPRLATGLAAELDGQAGAFSRSIDDVVGSDTVVASADDVGRALRELWQRCRAAGYAGDAGRELEHVYSNARAVVLEAMNREQGLRALGVMDNAEILRRVSEDLAMALSEPELSASFARALRELGVRTGYLAMCVDDVSQLRPLSALEAGNTVEVDTRPYAASMIFPAGFPRKGAPHSLSVLPLTVEKRVVGLVALAGRTDAFVCEALRSQLSASVGLIGLHARIVSETATRERLAQEQLLGELTIARRIQSALCPSDLAVSGFEVAAQLVAADRVGGDYYDVLPTENGCWLGIGDVTGHGLLAGLIMLMIQSSVSASVLTSADQRPSDVLCRVNAVLESNIRRRLNASEHATLLILRAYSDGRFVMAGQHEDVIVHRRASGRCELIATAGVWVGIIDDIRQETLDQTFQLEPGDTLVLYTDGLIEARDSREREFHIDQVCELISARAAEGPRAVVDFLIEKAHAWTPVQQDDITVVALRRNN